MFPTARSTRSRGGRGRTTFGARLRRLAWIAGLGLLAIVLLSLGERLLSWGKVLPGVDVPGTSVTGKAENAAFSAVEDRAAMLERAAVRARAGSQALSFARSAINYRVDAAATVRAARRAGRQGNPLAQLGGTILRRFRDDEVDLRVSYDRAALEGVLDGWARQVDNGLENGAIEFKGTSVVAIAPKNGTGMLRSGARRIVERALLRGDTGVLELPIGPVKPAVDARDVERAAMQARRVLAAPFTVTVDTTTLTLTPEQLASVLATRLDRGRLVLDVNRELLHAALGPALAPIETPPVDANFEIHPDNTVSVVPSVPGKLLDLDAVSGAIVAANRTMVGHIVTREPAHDTAWATKLNLTELVSTYTTKHAPGQPRVINIHKAADALNNAIVEPGQTFSLNERLGPRTLEKGYVPAPAIAADLGLEDAVGGGVSQVSTTLYNATFFGGYKVVEHVPHAYFIDRYPAGREATLNFPSIDNKFTNDSSSGILIKTSYGPTSITVSFYGNKESRTVRAEGPNILETTPFAIQDVDTPFLYQGESKEMQKGHDGLRVEVFRVISRPGQPDVRERLLTRYAMVPQKIAHGITPPTTTTAVPGAPTTTTAVPGAPTSSTVPPTAPPTAAPTPGG